MPHSKPLPVTQLFRVLREQLQTPQRDVAAHLGVTKQAVNNWARGMSLPQRYRVPLVELVDTKMGEALAHAAAHSRPAQTLLEMTLLGETKQNLYTALLLWRNECLADRGVFYRYGSEALDTLRRHWKAPEMVMQDLAQLEDAAKHFLQVVQTLKRLDTERTLPLHERWGPAVGEQDLSALLWRIYFWATGNEDDSEEQ